MKKTDRRVIKTKKSIRNAFNELLLKEDFKSITITKIAALADIDRKTFYLHYESIDSILEEFKEELNSKVLNLIKEEAFNDIEKFFRGLNDIMMENIEIYKKISKQTTYMFFLIDCKNILKDSIVKSFYEKSDMSLEVFNVYAEYISSGVINIYVDWLNSGSKLTLDELTNIAKDVVLCGWSKIVK